MKYYINYSLNFLFFYKDSSYSVSYSVHNNEIFIFTYLHY